MKNQVRIEIDKDVLNETNYLLKYVQFSGDGTAKAFRHGHSILINPDKGSKIEALVKCNLEAVYPQNYTIN